MSQREKFINSGHWFHTLWAKITSLDLVTSKQSSGNHKRSNCLYNDRFFHPIITDDKEWHVYSNINDWRQCLNLNIKSMPRVKQKLQLRKTMQCEWRDYESIIFLINFLSTTRQSRPQIPTIKLHRVSDPWKEISSVLWSPFATQQCSSLCGKILLPNT